MQEKNMTYGGRKNPCIRELTLLNGLSYPSNEELIMLILGKGTKGNPIEKMAQQILFQIEESDEKNLVENLRKIEGMGTSRALAMAAAIELGRRKNAHLRTVVNKPSDVVPYLRQYALKKSEHFVCVSINGAHEIMGMRVVCVGASNRALIHPSEIFAEPVAEHASAIICCHNHPCGPCIPSEADKETTRILAEASGILGLTFLDHIIINDTSYFSFLEHGMIYGNL